MFVCTVCMYVCMYVGNARNSEREGERGRGRGRRRGREERPLADVEPDTRGRKENCKHGIFNYVCIDVCMYVCKVYMYVQVFIA